jgi:hypothetical protein
VLFLWWWGWVLQSGDQSTTVSLCSAIGVPVESKEVPIAASFMAMTASHVLMASERTVYVWQYRSTISRALGPSAGGEAGAAAGAGIRKAVDREKMLDVDDMSTTPAQVGGAGVDITLSSPEGHDR